MKCKYLIERKEKLINLVKLERLKSNAYQWISVKHTKFNLY